MSSARSDTVLKGCVLVITRNGYGSVWRFGTLLDVRTHPITTTSEDVVAATGRELLDSYDRHEAPLLARWLPQGSTQRTQADDALKRWAEADSRQRRDEALRAADIVFDHLCKTAPKPPEDPATLVSTIVEDRRAIEGKVVRYRSDPENSEIKVMAKKAVSLAGSAGEEQKKAAKAAKATKTASTESSTGKKRAVRISDDTIVRMGKDSEGKTYGDGHSPKRPGSASAKRFESYADGRTVGEVKKAGATAADVAYDAAHGYIVLEAPVASAETTEEAPAAEVEADEAAEDAEQSED